MLYENAVQNVQLIDTRLGGYLSYYLRITYRISNYFVSSNFSGVEI